MSDLTALQKDIQEILQETREKVELVSAALIVTGYWMIGCRLDQEEKKTGSALPLKKLGALLELDTALLSRSLTFYREWPEGSPAQLYPQLSWSHYKELLVIKDPDKREKLLKQLQDQKWTIRQLRQKVQLAKSREKKSSQPESSQLLRRKQGAFHHYKGVVNRIIDGDTLLVEIDLGFEVWVKKRIRLRGIDALEKKTQEGLETIKYLENRIPPQSTVWVVTHVTDLHGRYVADIFYSDQNQKLENPFEEGVFLNQELLDKGLAILY